MSNYSDVAWPQRNIEETEALDGTLEEGGRLNPRHAICWQPG